MYKQVIVVRKDLDMSKGKIAVQIAHASLGSYKKADHRIRDKWEVEGSKKAVLKVGSENELLKIEELTRKAKIPCFLVRDAGRTQIPSGSITALGIGPDEEKKIDKITGKLKMY